MTAQGSPEWLAERCGKVTASRVADMMARTKSGWGASRANYAAELIAERLTGRPAERFQSQAMAWGTETEDQAAAAYAFMHDATLELAGFVPHPVIAMSGASPDRLVGEDGLVEIKCPNTATHIETLLSGSIPQKYIYQMQWQMACTGRRWCDWVSYDPRLPDHLSLFVSRVNRDNDMIEALERETLAFLAEIDATIAKLQRRAA